MKRFSPSDSFASLLYPPEVNTEKNLENLHQVPHTDFQSMFDSLEEEDCTEENCYGTGKKRRLSINQVQSLEKIFEVDNKLDPDRKAKIAQELGLKPRQVAIWFQNRRARWKTKQLERDYNILKSSYEALQVNHDKVKQEKEDLLAELTGLKMKFKEEEMPCNHSFQEADLSRGSENVISEHCNQPEYSTKTGYELNNNTMNLSDSDSSGALNEDSNLTSSQTFVSSEPYVPLIQPALSLSTSTYFPQCSEARPTMMKVSLPRFLKMDDQNLFSAEESCNLFSVDQAPSLYWYFHDQRN